eukprot:969910-Pyramimonas_sp.AAC.1
MAMFQVGFKKRAKAAFMEVFSPLRVSSEVGRRAPPVGSRSSWGIRQGWDSANRGHVRQLWETSRREEPELVWACSERNVFLAIKSGQSRS